MYVNFSLDEWKDYEQEYAEQALLACNNTLMINSLSDIPKSLGGSFYFKEGKIVNRTAFGKECILKIEI